MTPVRWSRSSTKRGAKANIYSGLVCLLLRIPYADNGCRQAVEKGVTGWLCEAKNADSLAACMELA